MGVPAQIVNNAKLLPVSSMNGIYCPRFAKKIQPNVGKKCTIYGFFNLSYRADKKRFPWEVVIAIYLEDHPRYRS